MLAPKIASPQAKAAGRAARPPAPLARPFGGAIAHKPPAAADAARDMPGAGWHFGSLPVFPPDQASQARAAGPGPAAGGALSGPGIPLPGSLRAAFEQRFGHDFSRVRVHTDARADTAARALDARAFTAGQDIAFRRGAYAPDSPAGRRLLAHELTHVVQQGMGRGFARQVSALGDAAELEAERVAASVSAGEHAGPIGAVPAAIARQSPPKPGGDYIEFEIEPGPPGQISARFTGPTDNPKWVDRALVAAAYNIWLNGYMIWLPGMTVDEQHPGIIVPESDIDFVTQRATAINHFIYNSRAEAKAAVAAAPRPADGAQPFAYYWGAGGLVVAPTTICPGTAPRTAATMWNARKDYAEYVQHALANLAMGMVLFRVLGLAYGWARAGGGGGGSKPPGGSSKTASGGEEGTPPGGGTRAKPPEVKPPGTEPPAAKVPETKPPETKPPEAKVPGGGGRLPVPPIPRGVKNLNEFGTKIMKWGTGSAEARARIGTLSRAELDQGGVTREMAEGWRDFYRNEMVRNPANPSAAGRADLMQRVLELLGEGVP